jgi:hypothetical protein
MWRARCWAAAWYGAHVPTDGPACLPCPPVQVHELGLRGIRSLAVARTNEAGEWQLLGILTFLDPPRPDTKDTIEKAMAFGVDVKMITGARPGPCCAAWVPSCCCTMLLASCLLPVLRPLWRKLPGSCCRRCSCLRCLPQATTL